MSEFAYALKLMLRTEGGYVNDPKDPGDETYKGVARKYNPDWLGWETIDFEKKRPNFPRSLDALTNLQLEVMDLYRKNYWEPAKCDMFPWPINVLVFDAAVNQGVNAALKLLQKSLHVAVDGIVGRRTVRALSKAAIPRLAALYLADRAMRYVGTRNFDRFGRGWFKRLFQLALEVRR